MSYEFKFADVGEGIVEGLLVKWRVKEGDLISRDQIIADIETDKAIVEIPSPKEGTILKLHFGENDTVHVGDVLVTIGETGEKVEKSPSKIETPKVEPPKHPPSVVGELREDLGFESSSSNKVIQKTTKGYETSIPYAMPRVRQLADELGVDISSIHGTGPAGRISEEDIRRVAQGKVAGEAEKYGPVERIPFVGTHKSTAEHLIRTTSTAAMVTHFDVVDVDALDIVRNKMNAQNGRRLSYLPFFIRAVINALKAFPIINSSLDETASEIVIKKYYHMGIAVDTDHGLVVPVIRDADKKSLIELATLAEGFAERSRKRTVGVDELRGGTFTISNVGMIGGIFATPIMPYPQSAILAIGRIRDVPVVRNGKIEIGKQAPLSLSFDHRLIDGADAARFVNRIIEEITNPEKLNS